METIRTNIIVSGLPDNAMDWDKVDKYAKEMKENDELTSHWGFPPITGYFSEISKDDIGDLFVWGDLDDAIEIKKEHIGKKVFFVTDGHHRVFAACKAQIWCIECEEDLTGFVSKNLTE
jgi:hypothetical protein